MVYILENDQLRIKVSSLGAELQSIRRLDDDTEYLWQGDPIYWARRASNLFPICGRLVGGAYTYAGQTYEMNIHGFARAKEWAVVHQKSHVLTLRLLSDEETLAMYPFRFALEMTYTLTENRLSVTTIVRNEDETVMPFALGGHPGFNVPLTEGERFEDYRVEFDAPCQPELLDLSDTCFYTGKDLPFPLEEERCLSLRHDLFDRDALFLKHTAGGITLCSETGARSIHVSYPDMPYLGLWHTPKTEAPFLCIEPWVGSPALENGSRALEDKPDMIPLDPGAVYRNTYVITLK